MTDTDFEARLTRSLQARAENAVEPFDASVIAETAMGASRPQHRRLRMVLAAAVVALAAVATAGAIVVGGGLLNPRPNPSPSLPVDIASPDASAEVSPEPETTRVVYTRWRRVADGEEGCDLPGQSGHCRYTSIYSSNPDGSDERLLFPEPHALIVTAAPDGSCLLYTSPSPRDS